MELFLGTYTSDPGFVKGTLNTGIPYYSFSSRSGTLRKLSTIPHPGNPSFLSVCRSRRLLISVAELDNLDGRPSGGVVCHAWNMQEKRWTLRDRVFSGGTFPCHIVFEPREQFAFVANYGDGIVSMFSISDVGYLRLTCVMTHKGSSMHPDRQNSPHPHNSLVDPSGGFLFVADLGIDRVKVYRIDRKRERLFPHSPDSIVIPEGSGPRHMAFHPEMEKLYVFSELTATITVIDCKYPFDTFRVIGTVDTLPGEYKGTPSGAEIVLHPQGRFLYVSNRGHDSISSYLIEQESGIPQLRATYSTGTTPRNFAISPDGNWLVVAHQDSGSVQAWSIDKATGCLERVGTPVEENAVACIEFG